MLRGVIHIPSGVIHSSIPKMIRQHHGSRIIELGARFCHSYLHAYWNEMNNVFVNNGELRVLNALAQVYGRGSSVVAFDVGTNVGDYTEAILQTMPETKVHCFEIIPSIYEDLRSRWRCHPAVVTNSFGLSDRDADVDVTFFPESRTEGRIHALRRNMRTEIVASHVRRGDDYMADQGINRVDFLKIDTEGHELFVLKGFVKALSEGRVTTIQFEYGTTWLGARTLLGDAYDLLLPLGYRIGRLFPDGVRFTDYHLDDEHFRMGNYIAVCANREDLIRVFEPHKSAGRRGMVSPPAGKAW